MERIEKKRVVPAATVSGADQAVRLGEALMAGGLDIIEITFRTEGAGDAIKALAERMPEMLIGAGTVLTSEQLSRAVDCGVKFAVAPGLDPVLVEQATAAGIVFAPGVVTPSEVTQAMNLGCKLLKFFPAEAMGGVKTLKALAGPYAHTGVKFVPTGGIGIANARDYLDLPVVAAVGGSWMVKKELVQDEQWDEITRLAKEAVALGQAGG